MESHNWRQETEKAKQGKAKQRKQEGTKERKKLINGKDAKNTAGPRATSARQQKNVWGPDPRDPVLV